MEIKKENRVEWVAGIARTDHLNIKNQEIMEDTLEMSMRDLLDNLKEHIKVTMHENINEDGSVDILIRSELRIATNK